MKSDDFLLLKNPRSGPPGRIAGAAPHKGKEIP